MVLLWLMQKCCKTRSQEDIQKSLKQIVVAPSKYSDMKDQLRIYICVLSILFGKESLLPRGVARFHSALIDYSSELKYKLDADKFSVAKMLLAMDQDIQRWLKERNKFKTREEVNDRILDGRVQEQILLRSPSCVQHQLNAEG